MDRFVYTGILTAHVLSGAAWFGAMLYSLLILHPRARAFFQSPRRFEEFVAFIAAGARWKVLGGMIFIGMTGLLLLLFPNPMTSAWIICMTLKGLLLISAMAIFSYASWRLWPARVLAAESEAALFQYRFRVVAILLITVAALSFFLSVLARYE